MTDTTRPTHTTDACGKDSAYGKDIAMTVIGAGSYGTSLAISLARNGANQSALTMHFFLISISQKA